MPYIMSDGVKLYFEENGSGYPIIFLHEFESDCRAWERQIRHFARGYRCITCNARGYPPSDVPEEQGSYSWEYAVDDIVAVMRGLAISRAHVVGTSMGGYTALQLGLRHPEKVSAIVAAATGSGSSTRERDNWLKKSEILARSFAARGMDAMARKMAHHPSRIQLKYKDPIAWREFVERLKQHSELGMSNTLSGYLALRPSLNDFRDQFSCMTVPILLAVGDDDGPCLETNLMLKSTLPAAGLWICANTGHAINLEEAAAFNAEVESFLCAVERKSWRRGYPQKALSVLSEVVPASSFDLDGGEQ